MPCVQEVRNVTERKEEKKSKNNLSIPIDYYDMELEQRV